MTDERDLEPLHGPDFVLDVENFGPIAEARDIAFKPMTVFVGPSNTGKSYLALLLHALLKGFQNATSFPRLPDEVWDETDFSDGAAKLWRETDQLTRRSIGNGGFNASDVVGLDAFSNETRMFIRGNIDQMLDLWSGEMVTSVSEYFEVGEATELANHRNHGQNSPCFTMQDSSESGSWRFKYRTGGPGFELAANELRWRIQDLARDIERLKGDIVGSREDWIPDRLLYTYMMSIISRFEPNNRSWYLLASRTGMLVSHRVLTDSIVSRSHRFGLGEDRRGEPSFHKVAADFLRAINAIHPYARMARRRAHGNDFGPLSRIADLIEREVLLGEIGVGVNEYGPPEFTFTPDAHSELMVPMMRSSSMATELAPIVAFLRWHIRRGDLLIIEEPEAHLHPSGQQRLAGVLAYMVRKGLRVLITTHSHYMVEAMGMFLNSSRVDPDKRVDSMRLLGEEVDRELYLNEDEVAVYSFDSANEVGTVVKQVPFDEDSLSFAPESYSDALVDQFNRISQVVGARIDADELAEAT